MMNVATLQGLPWWPAAAAASVGRPFPRLWRTPKPGGLAGYENEIRSERIRAGQAVIGAVAAASRSAPMPRPVKGRRTSTLQ
jgi:hypothetical protein